MTESAARTVSPGIGAFHHPDQPGLVVAVDGPAGSGKSTAARRVAAELGLRYLDTGAMYRALTWWLMQQGVDLTSTAAVLSRLDEPKIALTTDPASPQVSVDGQDAGGQIRSREVSNAVSAVAVIPQVRELLIGMQRELISAAAAGRGIVAEGRDIGTVVAPDAAVKVFLTASEEVRAQRRSAELTADPAATVERTRSEQARRDQRDSGQLAMAADAVEVDTSALDLDQVVATIVGLARAHQPVTHD